jgi:predicted nucleic acid-binding protein
MAERWVIDSSPLIVLADVGHKGLIRRLADEAMVPQAVADEILAGPHDDRARLQIVGREWSIVHAPRAPDDPLYSARALTALLSRTVEQ